MATNNRRSVEKVEADNKKTSESSSTHNKKLKDRNGIQLNKGNKSGVGENDFVILEFSNHDKLAMEIMEIDYLIETLSKSTRDNPSLCEQLNKKINEFIESRKENPGAILEELCAIKKRLKETIDLMPKEYINLWSSSKNMNRESLEKTVRELQTSIVKAALKPKHTFDRDVNSGEPEIREVTNKHHEKDMKEMLEALSKNKKIIIASQTKKDLLRNHYRLYNGADLMFERKSIGNDNVDESKKQNAKKEFEENIICLLSNLPEKTQMEVISHINQNELNNLHNCLQIGVSFGTLSPKDLEDSIDVRRNGEEVVISYAMESGVSLSVDDVVDIIKYDDESKLSIKREVVIKSGEKPEYGKITMNMYLNTGSFM